MWLQYAVRRTTATPSSTILRTLRQPYARSFATKPRLHARNPTPFCRPVTSNPLVRRAFSSTPPRPAPFGLKARWERIPRKVRTVLKYTGYAAGSTVFGVFILTSGILLHDAFTYRKKAVDDMSQYVDGVPTAPLALNPELGGPKNLPILRSYLSDIEDPQQSRVSEKPRLVIVGGGWGAVGVLQTIKPEDYHVTVISPETYNTFTPLLPSAAVGTIMVRSLVEPLRKIVARLRGHVLNAKAVDLVMGERLVEVEVVSPAVSQGKRIYVPYDVLVIACGSTSASHGVKGLEHCFQLKTIGDAQRIRQRVISNFEAAALPTTSPEERKRLLSFVICGGGPTGVETAAEIYDLCQEDILTYYPKVCRKDVSITVIQGRDHILNTYSEAISRYAEEKFQREGVTVLTNARVASVHDDHVLFTSKDENGRTVEHRLPTNFVLWSTGIAMNPFTARVSSLLPNQMHRKAIEVDAHLRVKGAPVGEVYAIGDASTIETSIISHLLELVDRSDYDKHGKIDYREWQKMVHEIKKRFPMSDVHLQEVRELFDLYDSDSDNSLTLNELAVLLQELGNKITALPPTAQVAAQEGKYLGAKLHKRAKRAGGGRSARDVADEDVAGPFKYQHLGSLAYIGNAAVFDFPRYSLMGGLVAMYLWRCIYWSEQVSWRTRALLMMDWTVRGIWGRDLSVLRVTPERDLVAVPDPHSKVI
ncbi:nucleotide-binding domain-containing protein [Phanerochaete sordida]|uniref:Nucleotide-binding domain-containing protein n=1 Tax=Phanerochaete sordida TaxID=48140 RepID=A0A9P3LNY4_9APHY|nr:nucleotide-binding domain-containing protein [Phanerochaete sordida]